MWIKKRIDPYLKNPKQIKQFETGRETDRLIPPLWVLISQRREKLKEINARIFRGPQGRRGEIAELDQADEGNGSQGNGCKQVEALIQAGGLHALIIYMTNKVTDIENMIIDILEA
jgi:hypothetical protein